MELHDVGVGAGGGGVGGAGGGTGGGGGGGVGLVTHLFLLHSKFGPIQSLSVLHVPVSGDEGESDDEGSVSDDFLNTKKYSNKPIVIRAAKIPPAIHIFLVDIPVSGMLRGDATGETTEMPAGDTTGETPEMSRGDARGYII